VLDAVKYVGIITTDANLIIRAWDPWLAEATGLREENVRNRSLLDTFPEIEARGLLPRLRRALDEGTVEILAPAFHHYLIRCAAAGAQPHFNEMQQHVAIAPIRDGENIRGLVITIEDVTARCVRERELSAQLKSPDENIRLRAARLLSQDSDNVAPLLDVIADTNWQVRKAAVVGMSEKADADVLAQLREIIRSEHNDLAKLNAALSALAQSKRDSLPLLFTLLEDSDPEVRMYAVLALGNIGDTRGVQAIVPLLEDADPNVQFHAVEALGRIRSHDAAMPLAQMLEQRDPYLSFAALDALALIGERSVAPAIMEMLTDPALASAAADALGALGDEHAAAAIARAFAHGFLDAPNATRALHDIHTRLEDEHHEGQLVADIVRPELGRTAIAKLVEAATDPHPSSATAIALVVGWLDFENVEQVLIGLLHDTSARRTALDALVRHGRRATPALIAALDDDDAEVRKSIALALGRIGDWSATIALTELLEDASTDVAIAAAGALGALGDRAAFDALLQAMTCANPAVRHAAVSAVNSIGHEDTESAARLLIKSPNEHERECGIRIAGYFGYDSCVSEVIGALSDPAEKVRRAAAEHLSFFDDAAARAALAYVAKDELPTVRAAAMRALLYVDDSPECIAILREGASDVDARVRYQAVQVIAARKLQELAPDTRALLTDDKSIPVRIAAAEALAGIQDEASVPLLTRLVDHPEADLACAAVSALGAFQAAKARAGLLNALKRDNERVRLAALDAIRINAHDFMIDLHKVAHGEDGRLARVAVRAIAEHANDESIDALVELTANDKRRSDVIAALAHADETHVPRIARGLQHRDANVRRAVVESLARMRRAAASRSLSVALHDADPAVRFAADQALRRLDMWHGMRRA
jgi:HEAT repeat protein